MHRVGKYRKGKYRVELALLPIVVTFIGCATYLGGEIPERKALPNRGTWPPEGSPQLIMSARLPQNANEVYEYFGADLLKHGFLPVEIYFESVSDTSDFEVFIDDFVFRVPGDDEGPGLERVRSEQIHDQVRYSTGWRSLGAFFCGIIPVFFVPMDVSAANREMLKDYRNKELEDLYLAAASKQNTERGVLFFRSTAGASLEEVPYDKGYLLVNVRRRAAGEQGSDDDLASDFDLRVDFRRF